MNDLETFSFEQVGRVDRRTGISYDEFIQDYLLPGIPVVLTDATQDWPAMSKWSPEYLQRHYGQRSVKLRDFPDREIDLGSYMDMVIASSVENPTPYLWGIDIENLFPELMADMQPAIKFAEPDRIQSRLHPLRFRIERTTAMLIGGAGARFPLHFDLLHTLGFVTQVYGDKEFTIFPPSQSKYLYPNPKAPNRSLVTDIAHPDLEKCPLFKQSKPLRTVVRKGETIFHPSGWWHTTRILTPSIAIVRSTVSPNIWSQFVTAYYGPAMRKAAPMKTRLKESYLRALHPLMSLLEFFHDLEYKANS
ncbi:MAG: cupin-like domain-containing protein [Gammaproteobacteria bacterium]|nr:cupin-like domain-containing protein [Gammaproteobacteria bacterium]